MGLGQRLSALGRSKKGRVSSGKQESEGKAMWEADAMPSDASTGGEGSLDSLGSLELGKANFPVCITESIGHAACFITIDSTRHGSRLVGNETSVVCMETRRSQRADRIGEESEIVGVEWEVEEVRDVTIAASTFARTVRARERMGEAATVRTSVDCVLDESVLTMDRENIFPELSYLTAPMIGRWETRLEASDLLDPLFKACGINYVKRFVVDKLALVIDISYSEDKTFFQLELQIPFGNRLMKWDLQGNNFRDNDPDCGMWDGHVDIVKVDLATVCPKNSKAHAVMQEVLSDLPANAKTEIYAPTQIRSHETIGIVHETRFSVPSKTYGKLLFLKYVLFPKNGGKQVVVTRCCKPVSA